MASSPCPRPALPHPPHLSPGAATSLPRYPSPHHRAQSTPSPHYRTPLTTTPQLAPLVSCLSPDCDFLCARTPTSNAPVLITEFPWNNGDRRPMEGESIMLIILSCHPHPVSSLLAVLHWHVVSQCQIVKPEMEQEDFTAFLINRIPTRPSNRGYFCLGVDVRYVLCSFSVMYNH